MVTPYRWTLDQILAATGGSLVSGTVDADFAGIGIDSRTVAPDDLFVAIRGESHDGHRFVAEVLDRGIRGIVVAGGQTSQLPMDRITGGPVACVAVADTVTALGAMARYNRNRGDLKVLAITGSNGKTSTRMLVDRVLAGTLETLSTRGNLNNHIGLPLTLFRLAPAHRAAVLELGMNHAGEITDLGRICEPDVGVITNVGPAHLEGLGSIDNVARAKGELLHTLRPGGLAILNRDDPRVAALAGIVDREVIYFGSDRQADVRGDDIRLTEAGMRFTLSTPAGSTRVALSTPARVMVSNALAAAAAGQAMGVPLERIKAGLEAFSPQAGRMGIRLAGRDIRLLDDTYNANPGSMAAAIETLARMRGTRRTLAVLGDMLELGDQSAVLHREIGRKVADARIDRLYAAGRFATDVADGAGERQMGADRLFTGNRDAIIDRLKTELRPGDLVLVKGSRGMAMETVVDAIMGWADGEEKEAGSQESE
ncbi:UDP-N-acetylmuramoyl-tripeptide--D-alanyl-D-alanine ligase [Desulfosarcina alkanivorans]|uniref:UDP-N-acetylmuramoyl-tripeptide--D-alanyl-D-alanine ligase n=1 Tax=Desulfosarcina alkanivorans TaxID=571177 RepID=A0A5K7YUC1_9BACT|nr:UDP-N-acetylmuramoyl-tripeptide--D-alanyl-D-alanine ligase [Desulfosarcina alkanivorans]BBO71890.1 UDP-N-acetylmuramoyl-tripeptide--D-alanyl-D-alanine ligase [Desulfosarcina alkanivorans]